MKKRQIIVTGSLAASLLLTNASAAFANLRPPVAPTTRTQSPESNNNETTTSGLNELDFDLDANNLDESGAWGEDARSGLEELGVSASQIHHLFKRR